MFKGTQGLQPSVVTVQQSLPPQAVGLSEILAYLSVTASLEAWRSVSTFDCHRGC